MKILDFAIKTAKKAGKLAIEAQQKTLIIKEKAKNDLVTNADLACEKLITEEIRKIFPDHAIIGEESSFIKKTSSEHAARARSKAKNLRLGEVLSRSELINNERTARVRSEAKNPRPGGVLSRSELYQIKDYAKSEFIWFIDPIDGTTNYAHGLKEYAISIGLFQLTSIESSKNFQYLSGELVLGVVFAPALNELFYAAKNHGAYLNGKKIHVSKQTKIDDSLLATGFPYQNRKMNLPYFSKMLDNCQAIRRLGAASLDLCYVAAGRFDGYWEFDMKPWDIAAGALIVKEAGGTVTDTNGNQIDLFGKDIFVSNGKIHTEIIKIFKTI